MMNNPIAQAVGIGIGVVPVFFVVFDTWIKLMQIELAKASLVQRDYPVDSALAAGLVMLVCIAGFVAGRALILAQGTLSNPNTSLDDYR
jgi:energy-converting hydrogenase Eha subunit H